MKTILFFKKISILAILLLCQKTNWAQKLPSQQLVNEQMNAAMAKSDLPALVATAMNKKGQRISYTFGKAVWTENTAITTKHIFRIASMTKLVTVNTLRAR
jgi:methyl acetate hydrolase